MCAVTFVHYDAKVKNILNDRKLKSIFLHTFMIL